VWSHNDGGHFVEIGLTLGAAGGLEASSLNLGADHLLAQVWLSAEEELVVVAAGIVTAGKTGESVEVELALERGQLGLTEVLGHDMVHELLWLVNNEAASVRLPGDNRGQTVGLDLIQHSVELQGEGNRDSSTTAVGLFLNVVLVGIIRMVVVIVHNEVTIVLLGGLAWLLWLPTTLGAGLLLLGLVNRGRSCVVEIASVRGDWLFSLNRRVAGVISGFYGGKDVAKETLRKH
jgi:hypothetical protein